MPNQQETVLGFNKMEKALIIALPMIVGVVLGWFTPVIANLLLKLPIVPMEKIFLFISSFHSFWVSIVAMGMGLVIGLFITLIIFHETLKVMINDSKIKLWGGDKEDEIEKKDISFIYVENESLVIIGLRHNELYRGAIEGKKDNFQRAFFHHGYPFLDEDPFIQDYKRWELGDDNCSTQINSILYARLNAWRGGKKKEEDYLREDLSKLGVVIRDEKNNQYIRFINENKR